MFDSKVLLILYLPNCKLYFSNSHHISRFNVDLSSLLKYCRSDIDDNRKSGPL